MQRSLITLENHVREFGDDFDSRYTTAVACLHLGRIQHYLDRFQAAEAYYRRALPLWEALADELPANSEYRLNLAGCLMNVGTIAYGRNPVDAEPFYRRALRLSEELAVQRPEDPGVRLQLANCLISSGRVFERSGFPEQAGPFYQRALPIIVRLTAEPLESSQAALLKKLLSDTCKCLRSVLTATGYADALDRLFGHTLLQLESLDPVPSDYSALVQNQWAWSLVTRPDLQSRNPRKAVELAKKAVGLAPKEATYRKTLGVALYRAGDWKQAVESLTKSMELGNGGNGNDWFFLAMAHWQLGDRTQARSWYDKAIPWMEKNQPKNEELVRFRAEATALLQVEERPH